MIIESVYIFNGNNILTIFDSYITSLDGVTSNRTIYKDVLCRNDMLNYLIEETLVNEFGKHVLRHTIPANTSIGGVTTNDIVDMIIKNTQIPNWLICKNIADIVTNIVKDNYADNYIMSIESTIVNSNIHVNMYVEIAD